MAAHPPAGGGPCGCFRLFAWKPFLGPSCDEDEEASLIVFVNQLQRSFITGSVNVSSVNVSSVVLTSSVTLSVSVWCSKYLHSCLYSDLSQKLTWPKLEVLFFLIQLQYTSGNTGNYIIGLSDRCVWDCVLLFFFFLTLGMRLLLFCLYRPTVSSHANVLHTWLFTSYMTFKLYINLLLFVLALVRCCTTLVCTVNLLPFFLFFLFFFWQTF